MLRARPAGWLMGAANVKVVVAHWAHLSGNAFKMLTYMAVTARDDDAPPRYWGGREDLALSIDRRPPAAYGPDADKQRQLDFKAVERVVAELIVEKAITLINRPAPGRNAIYQLNLSIEQPRPSGGHSGRPSMERPRHSGGHRGRGVDEDSTNAPGTADTTTPPQRANTPGTAGRTPPVQRGPEEEKPGEVGRENKEQSVDLRTELALPGTTNTADEQMSIGKRDEVPSGRDASRAPRGRAPSRAEQTIAESAARMAARRATARQAPTEPPTEGTEP